MPLHTRVNNMSIAKSYFYYLLNGKHWCGLRWYRKRKHFIRRCCALVFLSLLIRIVAFIIIIIATVFMYGLV